jgi:hypothetical protein
MKRYSKFLVLALVGILAVMSAFPTLADEEVNLDDLPHIEDSRVNAFDLAAPVVIYYTQESIQIFDSAGEPVWGDNGGYAYETVITGLELIGVNTDGSTYSVASLTTSDIDALLSSGESSLDLNGFVLDIQDDDYFLTAPADSEGKVYTFEWDDLGRTLPTEA